jgi:hypothetical protein
MHSTFLFFCADSTVTVVLHTYKACKRKDRAVHAKALTIGRGIAGQVGELRCFQGVIVLGILLKLRTQPLIAFRGAQVLQGSFRWIIASAGASLGSLVDPGLGTTMGYLAFSTIALAASSGVTDIIMGVP